MKSLVEVNPGFELFASDGALPLPDCVGPNSPTFDGYRPDCIFILKETDQVFFVEAKSYEDLFSDHSFDQFVLVKKFLERYSNLNFILGIFNAPDSVTLPESLEWLSRTPNCFIDFIGRNYEN